MSGQIEITEEMVEAGAEAVSLNLDDRSGFDTGTLDKATRRELLASVSRDCLEAALKARKGDGE